MTLNMAPDSNVLLLEFRVEVEQVTHCCLIQYFPGTFGHGALLK